MQTVTVRSWGARFVGLALALAFVAACTPTGDEQNGLIEPRQERGPYAPFLG